MLPLLRQKRGFRLSLGCPADGSGLQLVLFKAESICDLTKLVNLLKVQGPNDKSNKRPRRGPKRLESKVESQGEISASAYSGS